jgi:hypothetical protein
VAFMLSRGSPICGFVFCIGSHQYGECVYHVGVTNMATVSICGCAYHVGVTNMANVSITGVALMLVETQP